MKRFNQKLSVGLEDMDDRIPLHIRARGDAYHIQKNQLHPKSGRQYGISDYGIYRGDNLYAACDIPLNLSKMSDCYHANIIPPRYIH